MAGRHQHRRTGEHSFQARVVGHQGGRTPSSSSPAIDFLLRLTPHRSAASTAMIVRRVTVHHRCCRWRGSYKSSLGGWTAWSCRACLYLGWSNSQVCTNAWSVLFGVASGHVGKVKGWAFLPLRFVPFPVASAVQNTGLKFQGAVEQFLINLWGFFSRTLQGDLASINPLTLD